MKKARNPRYAPEFLERKLCPSGFSGNPGVTALSSTPDPAAVYNQSPLANPSMGNATDPAATASSIDQVGPTAADPAAINLTVADSSVTSGLGNPFNSDPASIDPAVTAVGPDPEPDPDSDPDAPEPPADPGRPPYVPLPPAPVGPAGPALSY
jgi:hypothetical protein